MTKVRIKAFMMGVELKDIDKKKLQVEFSIALFIPTKTKTQRRLTVKVAIDTTTIYDTPSKT
ncbi:hypothetical protein Bhyg_06937 [Pseudolycoriella hygida]|uniref:Uncharacterized protein n=1 Tax=Pseudolycoriella hygida TaxID=35572 RepID=A0A9Q0N1R8_9DIPT|nr:hypothetical protein Bhyg_06937 [Pseudolycoriella hygida]